MPLCARAQRHSIHLRSRPRHYIWNIHAHELTLFPADGKIDPLVRSVGVAKPGQCIWAFINGINNTKKEALESAEKISQAASGERVVSMPNDTALFGVKDVVVCVALKIDNRYSYRQVGC